MEKLLQKATKDLSSQVLPGTRVSEYEEIDVLDMSLVEEQVEGEATALSLVEEQIEGEATATMQLGNSPSLEADSGVRWVNDDPCASWALTRAAHFVPPDCRCRWSRARRPW